jgi:hypothetical protein
MLKQPRTLPSRYKQFLYAACQRSQPLAGICLGGAQREAGGLGGLSRIILGVHVVKAKRPNGCNLAYIFARFCPVEV